MAVPTGTASLLDIQNEFGGSNPIGLNEYYGAAAGVPTSGTISINNLRGKANVFIFSVTGSVQYANLNTLASNAGWDGSKPVTCTINSGVWLYSNSTGTAGLTIGSFPGGLTLANYGYIIGMGGNGSYSGSGAGGGVGLYNTSTGVTIQNYSYIAGGGGGGSGAWTNATRSGGGAGGSGGRAGGSGGAAGGGGTRSVPIYGGSGAGWGALGGYGYDHPGTGYAYRAGGAGGKAINSTQSYTLSNSGTIYGGT